MDEYFQLMKTFPELFVNSNNADSIKVITDSEEIRRVECTTGQKIGVIYRDNYIILLKDAVIFPNGSTGTYIRIISPKKEKGVVILPVINDKILLINHYRHALRKYLWELPRGFAESGMSIIENAKREFFEECGVEANICKILGTISPDSGLLGNEVVVVKTQFTGVCKKNDEQEAIKDYAFVSLDEALKMIATNQITDSITISAIMLEISQNFCS